VGNFKTQAALQAHCAAWAFKRTSIRCGSCQGALELKTYVWQKAIEKGTHVPLFFREKIVHILFYRVFLCWYFSARGAPNNTTNFRGKSMSMSKTFYQKNVPQKKSFVFLKTSPQPSDVLSRF
jgi:hypothetical protein